MGAQCTPPPSPPITTTTNTIAGTLHFKSTTTPSLNSTLQIYSNPSHCVGLQVLEAGGGPGLGELGAPTEIMAQRCITWNRLLRHPERLYSGMGVGLWIVKLRAPLPVLQSQAASYATGAAYSLISLLQKVPVL